MDDLVFTPTGYDRSVTDLLPACPFCVIPTHGCAANLTTSGAAWCLSMPPRSARAARKATLARRRLIGDPVTVSPKDFAREGRRSDRFSQAVVAALRKVVGKSRGQA